MTYRHRLLHSPRRPHGFVGILAIAMATLIGLVIAGTFVFITQLRPVNDVRQTQDFSISKGEGVLAIAENLKEEGLIRNSRAFQVYVLAKGMSGQLQAGSFALSPSQSTPEIVTTLARAGNATKLVTIVPGSRIDQVRATLINDGFDPAAVDRALQPAAYADLPVIGLLPPGVATLEGLLWPESFEKDASTQPEDIIRQSLEETGRRLTPEIKGGLQAQGLSPYEGLILASIITKEVNKPAEQAQVAQVFLKRLNMDISLGSDPTALYGAIVAGQEPSLRFDSPYNTRKYKGLPPTPIGTVTADALQAVINPADTDWLYFVSGDDGITRFSKTLAEHEALTERYCRELCSSY